MNERVPDSTGLPLRAMVMVLLFLGIIFLLLGWQAVGSSGNADEDSASPASSVSSATGTTSAAGSSGTSGKPAPAGQAEVRIYNVTSKEGIAGHARDQLTANGFKVTEVGNLQGTDIATTTVYYGDTEGERATAESVGQKLGAPVEPRIDAIKSQPPGVIVLVTG
jgi:LytR cell envelope-related transcriptional attenuator